MRLKKISWKDRSAFKHFLDQSPCVLSAYSFESVYVWKSLFDITWGIIDGCLCVFFKDAIGSFLYLPPLGKEVNNSLLATLFDMMDAQNTNRHVSRIENISASQVAVYQKLGYVCREKFGEYICKREAIARLAGNQLKHKRAAYNYFVKHYAPVYV